jgi:hypothetical protein
MFRTSPFDGPVAPVSVNVAAKVPPAPLGRGLYVPYQLVVPVNTLLPQSLSMATKLVVGLVRQLQQASVERRKPAHLGRSPVFQARPRGDRRGLDPGTLRPRTPGRGAGPAPSLPPRHAAMPSDDVSRRVAAARLRPWHFVTTIGIVGIGRVPGRRWAPHPGREGPSEQGGTLGPVHQVCCARGRKRPCVTDIKEVTREPPAFVAEDGRHGVRLSGCRNADARSLEPGRYGRGGGHPWAYRRAPRVGAASPPDLVPRSCDAAPWIPTRGAGLLRGASSPGRNRTYVACPDSKSGGPCQQTNRGPQRAMAHGIR